MSSSSSSSSSNSNSYLMNGDCPDRLISSALETLPLLYPGHYTYVAEHKVVLSAQYESLSKSQVTLISGGGSGHEPAHAGFVGHGMLTAAVCGNLFASPSVIQILTALRLVTGKHGCLVIVKNYTGDRINFGLAIEKARSEGLEVQMVIVGEDVAVSAGGVTGRRGLAGTVFVHKIAGAAAACGKSLAQVVEIATQVSQSMGTIGVALKSCTMPGKKSNVPNRIGDTKFELGLGIHGEPGIKQCDMSSSDEIVETMIEYILNGELSIPFSPNDNVIVLINNLGGTTELELTVVARKVLSCLKEKNLNVDRILVGNFMTALNMTGVSISILNHKLVHLDLNTCLTYVDFPVIVPGWPNPCCVLDENVKLSTPFLTIPSSKLDDSSIKTTNGNDSDVTGKANGDFFKSVLIGATSALIEAETELTKYDQILGDGDAGLTFRKASMVIQGGINSLPLHLPREILKALSELLQSANIGGTSGVLYEIAFTAASTHLLSTCIDTPVLSVSHWLEAAEKGIQAVSFYGGAQEGQRTMLDALFPALRSAQDVFLAMEDKNKHQDEVIKEVWKAALVGADSGASKTAHIPVKDAAGRTAYIGQDGTDGIPDPGAKAAAIWIRGVVNAISSNSMVLHP